LKKLEKLKDDYFLEINGTSGSRKMGYGPVAEHKKNEMSSMEERIHDLRLLREKLINDNNVVENGKNSSPVLSVQFINTTMTRILVISLLVFLVRILSNQYKYTMRMSSHFHSIADAIELLSDEKIDHKLLVSLVKGMNTGNFNFSEKAEVPMGLLAELLHLRSL